MGFFVVLGGPAVTVLVIVTITTEELLPVVVDFLVVDFLVVEMIVLVLVT